MVTFAYLEVILTMKERLKCAIVVCGDLWLTLVGLMVMLELSAISLDTLKEVCDIVVIGK